MTKKFLTYSMLAAAVMTGCTDEFQSYEAGDTGTVNGVKGKLVEAGLVGGTSVQGNSSTRAFTNNGNFVWMPEKLTGTGAIDLIDGVRSNQKIGLCWTGVNDVHPEYTALTEVGQNVFTNYEYEHIGWIDKDAKTLKFDECNGTLLNGAYIVDEGTPVADFNGPVDNEYIRRNKYYYEVPSNSKLAPIGSYANETKQLNLGSGIFKTENASVFEGKYVIYFPYTDKFTKGPIVANEPDNFVVDASYDILATASKYGFQVGYMNEYAGGQSSQNFTADNLASFAWVRLTSSLGRSKAANIKTVILYSGSEILYEYGIDAKSVITARDNNDMTLVKKVEDENVQQSTNAIYSYVKNSVAGTDYEHVSVSPLYPTHNLLALPVLPQTVKNLRVILVNDEGLTMEFPMEAETKFGANNTTVLSCDITSKTWTNTYYVVDEPSLAFALNKITTDGGTIKMLRSIDLEKTNDTSYNVDNTISYNGNVTIEPIEEGVDAKLIVKSGTVRNINSTAADKKLTINVPVIVEGYGCCSDEVATLNIGTDNVKDVVYFNKLFTNYGTTNVGVETSNNEVTFADVVNTWDDDYVKGQVSMNGANYTMGSYLRGKTKDAAKLNITNALATESIVKMNDLTNDGEVAVNSETPLATADDRGERSLKVNINSVLNTGKLANGKKKATAEADIVGGKITISQNALVTVEHGVNNMETTGYIKVNGIGDSDKTDGRLDIKDAGASYNAGTIDNNGVINLLKSHLNNEGIFMDNLSGQVGGISVYNGEEGVDGEYIQKYYMGIEATGEVVYQTDRKKGGIYVSKTNSEERMAFIITDAVESASCNVIEVLPAKDASDNKIDYTYDLSQSMYGGKDLRNYDVLVNADANKTTFKANHKNADGKYDLTKSIGHCLDVYSETELGDANVLTVENNVFVRENDVLTVTKTVSHLNVGKDVEVKKNATLTAVAVEGLFVTTDKAVTVGNDLKNFGTVTAGATPNVRNLVVKHNVINNEAASIATENRLTVGNDINNDGDITTNGTFTVGHDFNIGKKGTLDSNGNSNVVTNDFKLEGEATFEMKTTTTINQNFKSLAGSKFTREGLSGNVYRATVNVGKLAQTDGTAVGGWPTQM